MDFRTLLRLFGGGEVQAKGTPYGSGLLAAEPSYMISRGMGRAVTVGTFGDGIVGGGDGDVIDLDQPELAVAVPAGFCIRPLRITVQAQAGLIAADSNETECLVGVDSQGLWTGDGTFVSEQPSNLRTDLMKGSACRVGSAFSGNMTTTPGHGAAAAAAPVLDMELARSVSTADITGTGAHVVYKKNALLYEPANSPFLVGPCTLLVYFGGTVATLDGFVQASWIEGRVEEFFLK